MTKVVDDGLLRPLTSLKWSPEMTKLLKVAAAAAVAAMCMQAQAVLVLDDFATSPQFATDNDGSNATGVSATQVGDASILGGYRDIYVLKTAPAVNSGSSGVTAAAENGLFTFSETFGNVGYGVLRYDGVKTYGDVGVGVTDIRDADPSMWLLGAYAGTTIADLTAIGAGVNFTYSSDFVFDITILVYTGSGVSVAKQTTAVTGFEADGVTPIFKSDSILFNELIDLATGLPIDLTTLTDTRAIEVVFNGDLGKASIDLAFTPPTDIPEPTSVALAGLALLGLAAAKRRRKA